jgi:16S rRNA processing protein RimM
LPEPTPDDWIAVGQIVGVFGPSGEVRVRALGRFPQRFRDLRLVYLCDDHQPVNILQRRVTDKGVLLRLDAFSTREAARERIGTFLYLPESEAVQLPKGEYFVHQIVGLSVVTRAGEALGKVTDVITTGSNDVYVVRGPRGEVLLPALKEVIKQTDLDAGTMTVEPLPGLLD